MDVTIWRWIAMMSCKWSKSQRINNRCWFIQQQVAWDYNVSEPISELLNWSQTEEMKRMLMWWAITEQSSDFLYLEAFLPPSEKREVEDLNLGKRRNCQILASIWFHMLIHKKDIDLNEKGLNYCHQVISYFGFGTMLLSATTISIHFLEMYIFMRCIMYFQQF